MANRNPRNDAITPPAPSLRYTELATETIVADYVQSYWAFDVDSLGPQDYQHHVPPDGCVSLVIRYAESGDPPMILMVGPRTDSFQVTIASRDTFYGIRFWPHVSESVLGKNLEACREYVGPAIPFLPPITQHLMSDLPQDADTPLVIETLRQAARRFVDSRTGSYDFVVKSAVEAMVRDNGDTRIGKIASQLGISQRQLQRRFRAATGLTPKQFSRIRRFRRALAELLEQSPRRWVEIACEAGYADQAHLARDFTQMIGLTAEELRRKQAVIEHRDVVP